MRKGWRIVLFIVVAALFLGTVCVGVGVLTGADGDRIYQTLDERYHLGVYYDYYLQVYNALLATQIS